MKGTTRTRPLVSFIVPTLNRGQYVVRAVDSCLAVDAQAAGVEIEVVVLDSESDDDSWEQLRTKFSNDPRVTLAQNRRGLGPTHSWLDGAKLIKGDFVTFVWSDDYIAPDFLTVLVPALRGGATLCVGTGCERDIDNNTPLPSVPGGREIPREAFLSGYFRRGTDDGIYRPVSPTCSLFTRDAFDIWSSLVENWCVATPLRHQILWRRAIGPDLLLYFVALKLNRSAVPCMRDTTAQFSAHSGSITKSSSRWPYETGYWFARLWVLEDERTGAALPTESFAAGAAAVFVYGLILVAGAVLGTGLTKETRASSAIFGELSQLVRIVWRRRVVLTFCLSTVSELFLSSKRLLRLWRNKLKTRNQTK